MDIGVKKHMKEFLLVVQLAINFVKHIEELIGCVKDGYEAYILFVIQMKGVKDFRPNDDTHKAFGDALRKAAAAGVRILAYDCIVSPDSLDIDKKVKVKL